MAKNIKDSFLKKDTAKNQITVSKLFSWYIGDFGGSKGFISFLKNMK